MGGYPNAIVAEALHYTASYNKWTSPLERAAQVPPALAWQENGKAHHAFPRHQPQWRSVPQLFAVGRRRDGLFYHYSFIACDDAQEGCSARGRAASPEKRQVTVVRRSVEQAGSASSGPLGTAGPTRFTT
ncbi:MAG TPA: hypothetical protein VFY06_11520 [Verrucomicrobiae bacterium]|nr:hypothetical protein [Verrucomicrobiae bacterium]